MALIKCSECGNDVSSLAPACPKCGAPVNATLADDPEKQVVTTQQTAKEYKAIQIAGVGLIILGFVVLGIAKEPAAAWISAIGLAVYIYGRASAWWEHG